MTVYLPLLNQYAGKSAGKWYLDGWMDNITKKKRKQYLLMKYSLSSQCIRSACCRCKFNRYDWWLGATVKDMAHGMTQIKFMNVYKIKP